MGSSSSSWEAGGRGGGEGIGIAELDLSWMSFSPEAHGLKPALSVWPSTRSNGDNSGLHNYHTCTSYDQQQQEKRFGRGREGGWSQSGFDESDYGWIEEEIVEGELLEEDEEPLSRRGGDRRKQQARKVSEDFDYGDSDPDDEPTFLSYSSGASIGIRRSPSSPFVAGGVLMRGRKQQQKSWMRSLDEDNAAPPLPWITLFPKDLKLAAIVASMGCLMALAISIVLLYLSFVVTARPPNACEADKVVLNFSVQRIRLRGGRYISFREHGVGADRAQHSLLVVHDLLSSRLAGIPGVTDSLLKDFGVRLIAYDRPGYGQSDPYFGRSYNSSAQDMADIADALGLGEKFWVAGFGFGGPHVWAAVNYIPERLAGVAMFAPAGNFYAEGMTKNEIFETWGLLTLRQKWIYSMARLFPALLPSFLQKTLINHNPSPFRSMGGRTLGSQDQVLLEKEEILDFWKRDMREALQQNCAFPVAEELVLLVNNWGFSLGKLPLDEIEVKTLLQQVVGRLFQAKDKPRIFSGPIHIWQGSDDQQVPATFNAYAKRMIVTNSKRTDVVNLHVLEGEGHWSWFWFCDECHRSIFNALFQPETVRGPYGPQVFSAEEYEAVLAAFGGLKDRDRVETLKEGPVKSTLTEEGPVRLTKTKEALLKSMRKTEGAAVKGTNFKEPPGTLAKNAGRATDDALYRNAADSDETGIKLYVPESCDVPIYISAFAKKSRDKTIKK